MKGSKILTIPLIAAAIAAPGCRTTQGYVDPSEHPVAYTHNDTDPDALSEAVVYRVAGKQGQYLHFVVNKDKDLPKDLTDWNEVRVRIRYTTASGTFDKTYDSADGRTVDVNLALEGIDLDALRATGSISVVPIKKVEGNSWATSGPGFTDADLGDLGIGYGRSVRINQEDAPERPVVDPPAHRDEACERDAAEREARTNPPEVEDVPLVELPPVEPLPLRQRVPLDKDPHIRRTTNRVRDFVHYLGHLRNEYFMDVDSILEDWEQDILYDVEDAQDEMLNESEERRYKKQQEMLDELDRRVNTPTEGGR